MPISVTPRRRAAALCRHALHALLHRDRSQYPTYAAREAASERFNELYERHERARSARSNAEVDARNRAEDAEA